MVIFLQHTPLEQLDRKHFAKGDDLKKEIALLEVKMKRLCEILDEVSSYSFYVLCSNMCSQLSISAWVG